MIDRGGELVLCQLVAASVAICKEIMHGLILILTFVINTLRYLFGSPLPFIAVKVCMLHPINTHIDNCINTHMSTH